MATITTEVSPNALRAARIDAGLTIEQAAVHAGCSARTLSRAELGETQPRIPLLARLADLYGVTLGDLVHDSHSATPPSGGVEIGGGPTPAKKRAASTTQGA